MNIAVQEDKSDYTVQYEQEGERLEAEKPSFGKLWQSSRCEMSSTQSGVLTQCMGSKEQMYDLEKECWDITNVLMKQGMRKIEDSRWL